MDPPLRSRLAWRTRAEDSVTDFSDRAFAARVLTYMFAAGSLLGMISVPLAPSGASRTGTLIVALVALAAAVGVLFSWDRIPAWASPAIPILGTLLITAAIADNGGRADDTELLYLWVVVFSFYFFSWPRAVLHLAVTAGAYAAVLLRYDHTGAGPTRWVITVGTLAATGVLLRLLKDRLSRLIGRLGEAARTDPLTGLLNRRGFRESFALEIERARRTERPVSLLLGDLDGFKDVNDRYGHHVGDRALERIGPVLDRARRQIDVVARLGGDEFAVIVPESEAYGAFALAERLRREVAELFSSEAYDLGCSFGIASFPAHGSDADALMLAADEALYAAKALGRGATVIKSSHTAELAARPALEEPADGPATSPAAPAEASEREEIEAILAAPDGIVPVFQPVVALATGHVAGFEALARFPHPPQRGSQEWFAQAQRCGLGPQLEAKAIVAALAVDGRPAGTYLSVNASPSVLAAREVQDALPHDLSGLVIEITEQELISDDHGLEADLSNLRMRGARIAVDDAGSAYAGLQQVMRMQPDMIKLDRSLIDGVHQRADKAALVESFVRFAQRTGAAVCAEGIETLDDLAVLADLDVHYGQGYVLARPSPPWIEAEASVAKQLLRWSLQTHSSVTAPFDIFATADRRLEHLCARLSSVSSFPELGAIVDLVVAELHADEIALSRWRREEEAVEGLSDHSWRASGERVALAELPTSRSVLTSHVAQQILVGDPTGDAAEVAGLREAGFRSVLLLPLVCRGESFGLLEALSRNDRPWTRTEINRARIVAYQLGSVLESLSRPGDLVTDPAPPEPSAPLSLAPVTGAIRSGSSEAAR